jgi:hypothetical protein
MKSAAEAIARLEKAVPATRVGSRLNDAVVVAVCVLAIAALVIHTMYENEGPKVDEITGLLLAVLLIAPFVRHLRMLEVGGTKAEFTVEENASLGLSGVLDVIKQNYRALEQVYTTVNGLATEEAATLEQSPAPVDANSRLLRRILWVTARPEATSFEINACRQLFDIDIVKTVDEAILRLSGGQVDAVVSSLLYEQVGQWYLEAERLVDEAKQYAVPVFFYISHVAPNETATLLEHGAVAVTPEYAQLVRALRARARVCFDAVVRRQLAERVSDPSQVMEHHCDIDYILRLDERRSLLVETPHWIRTPPKNEAVNARYEKLAKAIADGCGSYAFLVTQSDMLTPSQRERAPNHVEPVLVDHLPARLDWFLEQTGS